MAAAKTMIGLMKMSVSRPFFDEPLCAAQMSPKRKRELFSLDEDQDTSRSERRSRHLTQDFDKGSPCHAHSQHAPQHLHALHLENHLDLLPRGSESPRLLVAGGMSRLGLGGGDDVMDYPALLPVQGNTNAMSHSTTVDKTTSHRPDLTSERREGSISGPSPVALWWSESEITGLGADPMDPTDDGEGINGIGFVPSPAVAHARTERRRKQVKEWRERETREARIRRGEMRRIRRGSQAPQGQQTRAQDRQASNRKVRFAE